MEIIYLDEVESTQLYLIDKIKKNELLPPVAVVAKRQTKGIGSRGNSWIGIDGNLFFSFALKESQFPLDLPVQSLSIYFSYILKEILSQKGSKVWLKWPNDFYVGKRKIGGAISSKISDVYICGIGLNIASCPENFAKLDIDIDIKELVEIFLRKIEKKISWKQIFSKYRLEFQLSKNFTFHLDGKKVSLKDAILCDDGSIEINNKRIYSLR